MANTTQTPNMLLQLPIPTQELGPAWSSELNSALTLVDSHDHSTNKGVPVTPSGLNINSDLSFGSNNATALRSTRFTSQGSAIGGASDIGCLYVVGNELYYNDVTGGHQIAITNNGSVTGSSGTISGLPSGTASAAFSAGSGTFVFQQATSTAANIDAATLIVRYPGSYPTPAGNYIAIEAPSSLSSGYSITLPSLPASTSLLTITSAGILSGTITSTNPNFPGKTMQENGSNVVVSNTNASVNSIAIIRIASDQNGNLTGGEGLTINHSATGTYVLTYLNAFSDGGVVTACCTGAGITVGIAVVSNQGTSGCTIKTYNTSGSLADSGWALVAMGQRA